MSAFSVVYDNDIGSDVDDALTLALLLGSPEVDLLGVTTVYGDTVLRARIAARLVRLAAGDRVVPCLPGSAQTLTRRDVWWAGHEGSTMDRLEQETVAGGDVVGYLNDQVHRGEVHVIATAPLVSFSPGA